MEQFQNKTVNFLWRILKAKNLKKELNRERQEVRHLKYNQYLNNKRKGHYYPERSRKKRVFFVGFWCGFRCLFLKSFKYIKLRSRFGNGLRKITILFTNNFI